MAKVLLVDTGFSAAPIYRSLVTAGHEVHVVGSNPADCLAKQAANYWEIDYSDTDALRGLIDRQGFHYLVPGCTDRSYESCVAAGQGRFAGLDSPDALSVVSNKGAFRRVAAVLGLPTPMVFSDPESAIGHDVIVKPVDAFSGKGITVLYGANAGEIEEAVARALTCSPSRGVLIEEFVEGQLYSHSAFLVGCKVSCDFLVREDGTANKFVVDTSRVLDPFEYESLLRQVRESVEALAHHLNLKDGLLHTQLIASSEQIWLIEMTRRCPGDLYSQLIELSTGYPYARSYSMSFLGIAAVPLDDAPLRPVMRHTISVSSVQVFDHVRFLRVLEIERYVPVCLVGATLLPSPQSRVAVIFCHEQSQELLDDLYMTALRRELYVVSDGA